jgi:hypothetical protein
VLRSSLCCEHYRTLNALVRTGSNAKKPMNWDDYEYGRSPRQGSMGSQTSRVKFDQPSPPGTSDRLNIPRHSSGSSQSGNELRSRRCVSPHDLFYCGPWVLATRLHGHMSRLSRRNANSFVFVTKVIHIYAPQLDNASRRCE